MDSSCEEYPVVPEQSSSVLTVEDFVSNPDIIPTEYTDNPPSHITRQNFTSWIVRGFALSRGDIRRQSEYVLWSSTVGDFEAFSTINVFLQAGGYKALSGAEKEYFDTRFRAVKEHGSTTRPQNVEGQLRKLRSYENYSDIASLQIHPSASLVYSQINSNAQRELFNSWGYSQYMSDPYAVPDPELNEAWEKVRRKRLNDAFGRMSKEEFLKHLREM